MTIKPAIFVQFLCIGWLGIVALFSFTHRDIWPQVSAPKQPLQLQGIVQDHVSTEDFKQTVRIAVTQPELPGYVQIKTGAWPALSVGDEIRATCQVRPISELVYGEFRYDRYLAKEGVFATCENWESPKVIGHKHSFRSRLFSVRRSVEKHIQSSLPEPHASLMAGLLYGARSTLPKETQEDFRRTGTMHIVAVSGYNVTLVASILLTILTATLLKRQQAFWVVLCGIVLYVFFAGGDPAVVRAGIMGSLVLIAKQVGRPKQTVTLFLLAATLMTALNYRILLDDVGFHLSFAAAIGLVALGPRISGALPFVPARFGLRSTLAETLAATICTLPIALWQFKQASLVSPIANLFVVPLTSITTVTGGVSLLLGRLAGILHPDAARWILLPTYALLEIILRLVELFSPLPFIDFSV